MKSSNLFLKKVFSCAEQGIPVRSVLDDAQIRRLVLDKNAEVRNLMAEALVFDQPDAFITEQLCLLARDADALVRTNALDSLGSFVSEESFQLLIDSLSESDSLARMYAVLSVVDVGKILNPRQTRDLLMQLEETEQDGLVLNAIYRGQYILGQKDTLELMMAQYAEGDYYVRCSVLRSLAEIFSAENSDKIKAFAESVDPNESVAVRDAFLELKAQMTRSTPRKDQ